MKLLDYIQGFRKGKEAHRIEKEAMRDPFLADALEGYDRVKGNHAETIETLQKRIRQRSVKRQPAVLQWSVAASLLAVLSLGGYFLLKTDLSGNIDHIALQEKSIEESSVNSPPPPMISYKAAPPVTVEEEESEINSMDNIMVQADKLIPEEEKAEPESTAIIQTAPAAMMTRSASKSLSKDKEDIPEPVNGKKAFEEYVKENAVLPEEADCEKGDVSIKFFVNEAGKPYDLRLTKKLCPEADQKALQLIEEGPLWTVGEKEVTITISF